MIQLDTGEIIHRFEAHAMKGGLSSIKKLLFSPDGHRLYSYVREGQVRVWAVV